MRVTSSDYPRRAAETISENPAVRTAVTDATLAFEESRVRAWAEIDAEAWRTWASQVKDRGTASLLFVIGTGFGGQG